MAEQKPTLGKVIDKIIEALDSLDPDTRHTAIEAACSHLDIKPVASSAPPVSNPIQPSSPTLTDPLHGATPQLPAQIDIKTLKEQKKPASAAQMACVVAYYLQELAPINGRKNTVKTEDMQKYFKQAGFKLRSSMPQLLRDCKSAGYFDSAPGRGEYSLNAVGYNLVVHNLPKSKER